MIEKPARCSRSTHSSALKAQFALGAMRDDKIYGQAPDGALLTGCRAVTRRVPVTPAVAPERHTGAGRALGGAGESTTADQAGPAAQPGARARLISQGQSVAEAAACCSCQKKVDTIFRKAGEATHRRYFGDPRVAQSKVERHSYKCMAESSKLVDQKSMAGRTATSWARGTGYTNGVLVVSAALIFFNQILVIRTVISLKLKC